MKRRVIPWVAAFAFTLASPIPASPPPLPSACSTLAAQAAADVPVSGFMTSWPASHEAALHAAAFTYDNALVVLALTGCERPDLARRIATALLYAQEHDRYWHDGRLRNGYAAGELVSGTAPLAGWWDTERGRWLEDGYQAGSDTGNQAFALLALLAAADAANEPAFLQGAIRLGIHVLSQFDSRGVPGFTGGFVGHEPQPRVSTWKSTEHNADLYAAFTGLAARSKDPRWAVAAGRARDFVESMWRADCTCFAVGTRDDGVTPNSLLALDAQVLPLLALPDATPRSAGVFSPMAAKLAGGGGYRYSEAPGAMWIEGSAQVVLAMRRSGRSAAADTLLQLIDAQRDARGRFFAAGVGGTSTGFAVANVPGTQRIYAHEPHLAALAWAAMAERQFNPLATATYAWRSS
jgi:hypothetical protein